MGARSAGSSGFAAFEIELDDGARVRVELGEQRVIAPVPPRRGTWRQLADAEIAELGSRDPAPDVNVELRREHLAEGARVEVLANESSTPSRNEAGTAARRRGASRASPVLVRRVVAQDGALFFAVGRGRSARSTARRLVWMQRAPSAAILACGFAEGALLAWVKPHLFAFHMPDHG